jgi:hypothetical protein
LYAALFAAVVGSISGYVLWRNFVVDMKRKGLQEDFIHVPRAQHSFVDEEMEPEENTSRYRNDQTSLIAEAEEVEVEDEIDEEVYAEDDTTEEAHDDTLDKHKTLEELAEDMDHTPRSVRPTPSANDSVSKEKAHERIGFDF